MKDEQEPARRTVRERRRPLYRTRSTGANYQTWGKLQPNKTSHNLKKKKKKLMGK